LHPPTHEVWKNGATLDGNLATLAEILRSNAYHTYGVVGSFVLSSRFGYDQGFDHWDEDFDSATSSTPDRSEWLDFDVSQGFDRKADETTRRAIEWLGQRDEKSPFFLFVHFYDPHQPYAPPEPFRSLFDSGSDDDVQNRVNQYDGEIAFVDYQVGKLLQALDRAELRDETLVVITGDHGEGLMQRGFWNHSVHLYEEGVRVPLLFRFPKRIAKGTVIESPVAGVDLLPTILDLLSGDLPAEHEFQGQSLASALRGGDEPDRDRPIFLTRRHYNPGKVGPIEVNGFRYAIRSGRWKFFAASEDGPSELYDLIDDPMERVDRTASDPTRATALAKRIDDWLGGQGAGKPTPLELSDAERKKLEALGYVE
jgi:arylsulfatase A-like enzyme